MRALLAAIASAALASVAVAAEPAEPRIDSALAALAAGLDPRAASALASIDGRGQRLLAARAYLRASSQLEGRWSWSATEAAAFEVSPEKRALDAAIARVRCQFEADNPGHTLWVNPEFRSLDVQLERWNGNETVALAGAQLLASVRRALAAAELDRAGSAADVSALRRLLLEHQPSPVPTLAAPGLSPHGRMRAIDFQVESSGRIVAGTDSASIAPEWIAAGWKARLQAAVSAADAGFQGPLAAPDEPWHYEFRPEAGQGDSGHAAACARAT
ncbi:MAG TPA: hypothetical protein VNO53_08850 [Steroidobacteraceae bacterium]|nr:hypothetical protein [Steroidobacteraceae bacterium]